jgi:hypothetical protein
MVDNMKKLFIALLIFSLCSPCSARVIIARGSGGGADVTPPTVTEGAGTNIDTNGTLLTVAFSEAVSEGTGYDDADWTLTCSTTGPLTVAHTTGDGTSSWGFSITGGPVQESGTDTCTLDWAGTADGVEDGAGNDLAAIDPVKSIVNGSTQGGGYATPTRVDFDSVYTGAYDTNAVVDASSGDTVVLIATGTDTQTMTGVTANAGSGTCGSWTQIIASTSDKSAQLDAWYASVTGTGTIEVRPTGNASDAGYVLIAYSGVDPATQIAATNEGVNGGTTFTCAAIAVGLSGSLGIAAWASEDADSTVVWHDGGTSPDYSMFVDDNSHYHSVADKVTTSADDYNFAPTWTGNNKADGIVIYIAPAAL